MFDPESTKEAITRVKSFNDNSARLVIHELKNSPALAFCWDSIVFNLAKEISQYLSEYHVWTQHTGKQKNQLIERMAEKRGVKVTTIKSHINYSGPLISEILRWLGQELWAMVILLLVYLRLSLDFQGAAVPCLVCLGNFKDLDLQEKMTKLAELIPNTKQYWGNQKLQSDNVLWVMEVAYSRKSPFRDQGRRHQRSPRRRTFEPPLTRSLQELKLPSMLRERSNS